MIDEILLSFLYKSGHQKIWAPTWKPEEIWPCIFLRPCEFNYYIADLIGFLYIFQFSLNNTHVFLIKKESKPIGYFNFSEYFFFTPDEGFYWWIKGRVENKPTWLSHGQLWTNFGPTWGNSLTNPMLITAFY